MVTGVKLSKSQAEQLAQLVNSIPDFVLINGTPKELDNFDYDGYYRAFPNKQPKDYNLYSVQINTNPKSISYKPNSVELYDYFRNVDKINRHC